jgi:hypothetical protein
VSENVGIKTRTVATSALAVTDALSTRLDLIHTRLQISSISHPQVNISGNVSSGWGEGGSGCLVIRRMELKGIEQFPLPAVQAEVTLTINGRMGVLGCVRVGRYYLTYFEAR